MAKNPKIELPLRNDFGILCDPKIAPQKTADTVCFTLPIKMMAKRLCQVPGFRAYCSKLGVGPDCVAQHIIFDGYAKVKAVIERGLEPVYGETIVLFSMPIVGYELE